MAEKDNKGNAFLGGMGALGSLMFRSGDFKHDFEDRIDRARLASEVDNIRDWKRRLLIPKRTIDPRMAGAWIRGGAYGVAKEANEIFKDHVPTYKGQEWEPSDITNQGSFKAARSANPSLQNIFTVTPSDQTARFQSNKSNVVGGGASNTIWGNTGEIQPGYAIGNTQVKAIESSNPAVHLTAAELPINQRREYMFTGDSQEVDPAKRGWGLKTRDPKAAPSSGSYDMHFGPEHRRYAGLVTANDMYTYLKSQGADVPDSFGKGPSDILVDLTDRLRETMGTATGEEALVNLATEESLDGKINRNTGKLPRSNYRDWRLPDETQNALGERKFIQRAGPNVKAAKEKYGPLLIDQKGVKTSQQVAADQSLDERLYRYQGKPLRNGPQTVNGQTFTNHTGMPNSAREFPVVGGRSTPLQHGSALTRRFAPGLVGTALTMPSAADELRKGNTWNAVGQVGLGYAGGEFAAGGFNAAVNALAPRAPEITTRLVQGARGFGSLMSSPAVMGTTALDTLSTGLTGRNSREQLVDTGNTGPAIAASMAPTTIAPLGMAGPTASSVGMQGNHGGKKNSAAETRWKQRQNAKRISEARKLPGQLKIGGLRVPDFGVSEFFGIKTRGE